MSNNINLLIPEDTEIGKALIPKGNIKLQIAEQLIKSNEDRSYEFRFKDPKVVPIFIRGLDSEKDIPLIKFPLVIKTANTTRVVSNIVGAVKQEVGRGLIESKRTDYVDFEVVRTILTCYTVAGLSIPVSLRNTTSLLATKWFTTQLISSLRLDTLTASDLEIAVSIYFYKKYSEVKLKDTIILDRLSASTGGPTNRPYSYLNDKLSLANELNDNATLSQYINKICSEHKILSRIDDKAILAVVVPTWYSGSDSSNVQILLGLENLHTMTAIMYHSYTTATGKKTALGRLLQSMNKAYSNSAEMLSGYVKDILKDNRVY